MKFSEEKRKTFHDTKNFKRENFTVFRNEKMNESLVSHFKNLQSLFELNCHSKINKMIAIFVSVGTRPDSSRLEFDKSSISSQSLRVQYYSTRLYLNPRPDSSPTKIFNRTSGDLNWSNFRPDPIQLNFILNSTRPSNELDPKKYLADPNWTYSKNNVKLLNRLDKVILGRVKSVHRRIESGSSRVNSKISSIESSLVE